jgi:hypothetical protein
MIALCTPQMLVISADIVGAFGATPLWIIRYSFDSIQPFASFTLTV